MTSLANLQIVMYEVATKIRIYYKIILIICSIVLSAIGTLMIIGYVLILGQLSNPTYIRMELKHNLICRNRIFWHTSEGKQWTHWSWGATSKRQKVARLISNFFASCGGIGCIVRWTNDSRERSRLWTKNNPEASIRTWRILTEIVGIGLNLLKHANK